jgi:hypothetical protein
MTVPLLAPGLEIPGDQAGTGRALANSLGLLTELAKLAAPLLVVLATVLLASRRTATEIVTTIRAPSARSVRVGLLALVFAIPFALNRLYFATYYALFAWVWLALWLGTILTSAWRPSPRLRWLLAIGSAAVLVPVGAMLAVVERTPDNDVERWTREAAHVLEGEPRLVSVRLHASCADEGSTRASEALLRRYFRLSDDGMSLRWALELDPALPIGIDLEARTTLLYCERASPRFVRAR